MCLHQCTYMVYLHIYVQDDITLKNFDKVLTGLSGAVRGAALSESEQTSNNLAITSAVFTKSATLINPTVVIKDGVCPLHANNLTC